jgi:hypothetical protein
MSLSSFSKLHSIPTNHSSMPQHHSDDSDRHGTSPAPTATLRELSRMRRQTVRALLLQHVEMEQQQSQQQQQQPQQEQSQVQQESYNHSTTTSTTDSGVDHSTRTGAAAGTASLVRELSRLRRQNRRAVLQRLELERQDQTTVPSPPHVDKLRPSLSTVSERTEEEELHQQQQQQQYDGDDEMMMGPIMRIKSPLPSTTSNQPNFDHQSPPRGRGSRHRVHDRRLESPLRE